jgi:hypothetical protein
MNLKVPQAWIGAKLVSPIEEVTSDQATEVKARVDMSENVAGKGLCPECRQPMQIAQCGPSASWVCAADRISLPIPNGYNAVSV